ncbi:MAG TPA: MFS transporter [Stellaceae bacterium]|nr:MFS transporter [Stellaceae bacterium]
MARDMPDPLPQAAAAGGGLAASPGALVAVLCLAEVLGMLGSSSFPALLPQFQAEWSLSNTEAGWISGIFFAGYVAAVPVLVGSTDRVDPRRIYLLSFVIAAIASLGYALFAQGFWSALALRALAGMGLAGGYMPGLKLLTDRVGGPRQGRYIAFYTGGYSLGTAFSFAFTGEAASWLGWRGAFAAAAAGAALGFLLVLSLVRRATEEELAGEAAPRWALDFRPVFANRAAMAFILGYSGHAWELFALRSWLVAFLVQAARLAGDSAGIAKASGLTTAIVLISAGASIYGAELAIRSDRRRVIGRIMLLSVAVAIATGLSAGAPVALVAALCLAYHMVIMGDSAALTGGAVLAAAPGQRGATLAVHSILGFGAGFIGPLAVGLVLDLAGGEGSRLAWALAFLAMGAGSAAAFLAIRRL